MLNAFRYSVFGIPPRDFEKTWFDVTETAGQINQSQTFDAPHSTTHVSTNLNFFPKPNSNSKLCIYFRINR